MTQIPTGSGSFQQEAAPRPGTSGLAITSLVLGILAVATVCVMVGPLLGLVAIILGIVALLSIGKPNQPSGGTGMAITGIVTGGLSLLMIPLMIAMLLPALSQARSTARVAQNMNHLRMFSVAMMMYESDHGAMPSDPAAFVSYLNGPSDYLSAFNDTPNASPSQLGTNGPAVRYGDIVFILPDGRLSDVTDPFQRMVAYFAWVDAIENKRVVLFADGHAQTITDASEFATMCAELGVSPAQLEGY